MKDEVYEIFKAAREKGEDPNIIVLPSLDPIEHERQKIADQVTARLEDDGDDPFVHNLRDQYALQYDVTVDAFRYAMPSKAMAERVTERLEQGNGQWILNGDYFERTTADGIERQFILRSIDGTQTVAPCNIDAKRKIAELKSNGKSFSL